jgi:ribosomal protein S26
MSGGFFIFGRQTKKDYGATAYVQCPNCHNKTFFNLVFIKTWLEYFFIKIYAYKRRYYLLCDICSRGVELRGREIDSAKKLNEATLAYLNKSISDEQYQTALTEVRGELETALEYLTP